MASKIFAVIVTFNRSNLLHRCLKVVSEQTRPLDRIIVVNNASTDHTVQSLRTQGWLERSSFELLSLSENLGGAGGFAVGLQHALRNGAEWVWMMDDDAEPKIDALAELMNVADTSSDIFGSLAIAGNDTAWATILYNPPLGKVENIQDFPERAEVEMLPLLGLLVHRDLAARIGAPDSSLFIAGDDAEYCVRARRAGARIFMAGKSHINHPKSSGRTVSFLGKNIIYLSLPPWKRYYDTRNRLLIARQYYGIRIFSQTIPGSILRLFIALQSESDKISQLHAFFAGFTDGLLGLRGKRHAKWGIKS